MGGRASSRAARECASGPRPEVVLERSKILSDVLRRVLSLLKCMKDKHPVPGGTERTAPTAKNSGSSNPSLWDLSEQPKPKAKSRKNPQAVCGGAAQAQYISPTTRPLSPCVGEIFAISRLRFIRPLPNFSAREVDIAESSCGGEL